MRRIAIGMAILSWGCASPRSLVASPSAMDMIFREAFDDPSEAAQSWVAEPPTRAGDVVRLDREASNSFISLVVPERDAHELALRRSIDLSAFRGQRLRISARIRVQASSAGSAHVRLSAPSLNGETYSEFADSRSLTAGDWRATYAVVDIPRSATRGDIRLVLSGSGTASFDDIAISTFGCSPSSDATTLSKPTIARLTALAQAIAQVRYFHPSDQSAKLDWNEFSIQAIRTVLAEPETHNMRDILARLFAPIAPTARFSDSGARSMVPNQGITGLTLSRDPRATGLVRWRHLGLGSEGASNQYHSFRDGIGEDEASAYVYATLEKSRLATCRHAEIQATIHAATGQTWIVGTMYQAANRTSYIRQPVESQHNMMVLARGDIPADIQQMKIGIYLSGRSSIELSRMSIHCDGGEVIALDARTAWDLTRDQALYDKSITECGNQSCLAVRRSQPDTEGRWERDVVETDLGSDVHMTLPIAVWSDGNNTFPEVPVPELSMPDYAIADLPVRLAAVTTIWNTLLWFYPYFGDQRVNWPAALPGALQEAAAAISPEDTHRALSRLVAKLEDGHAHVRHPTHSVTGMLPIALRRFGERIFVIGGMSEYMSAIPVGSELVSVNGVPASTLYNSNANLVSAATPQFKDYLASLYISIGPIGILKHIQVRSPAGDDEDVLLPLVSRQNFDQDIHFRHPKSGIEIAPSVFYADAASLEVSKIPALIQSANAARAVILDVRGGMNNAVFEFLAHFVSHAIPTPRFRAPIVSIRGSGGYQDWGWNLWPAAPQLGARLIVLAEARAVSVSETLLEMVHDSHLGTIVGEPTAGTNGDVNTFLVPGGFSVRFTGLRTSDPDDSTIQGNGIQPDQVVHPTMGGIRAGHDEVLEAAISLAEQPAPK